MDFEDTSNAQVRVAAKPHSGSTRLGPESDGHIWRFKQPENGRKSLLSWTLLIGNRRWSGGGGGGAQAAVPFTTSVGEPIIAHHNAKQDGLFRPAGRMIQIEDNEITFDQISYQFYKLIYADACRWNSFMGISKNNLQPSSEISYLQNETFAFRPNCRNDLPTHAQ
jgi:hypothetical protein